MFVLLCSFTKKKTDSVLSRHFPPRVVIYPEQGTLLDVSRSGYI